MVRKRRRTYRRITKIIKFVLAWTFLFGLMWGAFHLPQWVYAAYHKFVGVEFQENKYTYHHLAVAEQKDVDTLFEPQAQQEQIHVYVETDDCFVKLHITEGDADSVVCQSSLEYFEALVNEVLEKGVTLDSSAIEQNVEQMGIISNNVYADTHFNSFRASSHVNIENAYQIANALFDDMGKRHGRDGLVTAALIVYFNDVYLSGGEAHESVEASEKMHTDAKALFGNGKTYYILAEDTTISPEYENVFWMLAYAYMKVALENADEDETYFASIHYYLGNIGYHLLGTMEDEARTSMKEETIRHLNIAQACIGDKRYNVERGMKEEIDHMLNDDLLR